MIAFPGTVPFVLQEHAPPCDTTDDFATRTHCPNGALTTSLRWCCVISFDTGVRVLNQQCPIHAADHPVAVAAAAAAAVAVPVDHVPSPPIRRVCSYSTTTHRRRQAIVLLRHRPRPTRISARQPPRQRPQPRLPVAPTISARPRSRRSTRIRYAAVPAEVRATVVVRAVREGRVLVAAAEGEERLDSAIIIC